MSRRARMAAVLVLVLTVLTVTGVAGATAVDDVKAAAAAANRGDFDQAIQLYTRAINSHDLKPADRAVAYNNRGAAYNKKGDYETAIADFNAALALNPRLAQAYNNRGWANYRKGAFDVALRDYQAAVKLNATYANAWYGLGATHFALGQWIDATAELGHAVEANPKDAYNVLWLHLARGKAGQPDGDEFARNAEAVSLGVWPGPVVRFYQRHLSIDQLLEAANNPDARTAMSQRCEALFYIGEQEILDRNSAGAERHLTDAVGICPRTLWEYTASKAELARMGAARTH